jgi:cysteinyl-tRNA synthetase
MTAEEKEAKDKFFDDIISSLAPEGAIESQFAHSVADGHWRLNRASSIESNIFTLACSFEARSDASIEDSDETPGDSDETNSPEVNKALGAARVFIADPKRFQLLTIYEGRIHRNMTKNLQQLNELQAIRHAAETSRKAQREQALEEARLHTQLAEMEGVVCDIATDFPETGFVFTTSEIAQAIRRANHLRAAHKAESTNWTWPIRSAA